MPPTHAERRIRLALRALVAALATAAAAAAPASASTITVDDDGADCPNAPFTSIQAAIDQAAGFDTVAICPGTYVESAASFEGTGRNGLLIRKNLTLKGAGADKVFIRPSSAPSDTLAGPAPTLLDGGGNVITVARQSLGSTTESEIAVTISGVTVESPGVYAEAGIAFSNTSGNVVDSVVGPLRRATSGAELADRPLGWGIVASNSYLGTGAPTAPLRRVRVDSSLVTGYQSGGIRIDAATQAAPLVRSGMLEIGEITDSVVEGSGAAPFIPQTGIQFHAGAKGLVEDSSVTGNLHPPDPRKSVGILLTDSDPVDVSGSEILGNGYGVFNANVDNTAVRVGAPVDASGNFWGPGGPPLKGTPSDIAGGREGYSGDDSNAAASVIVNPLLFSEPAEPDVPGAVVDDAPSVAIGEPVAGDELSADETYLVNVGASDDYGVKSVKLFLAGEEIGSDSKSPYEIPLKPADALAGETQELMATAVDSSGQETSETISVSVIDPTPPPSDGGGGTEEPPPPGSPSGPSEPAPLLLRALIGLPGSVRPEMGLTLSLDASAATRATYKLGSKVICQSTAAPFACTYLPTTAEVGAQTLRVEIADDLGRVTFKEVALTVQRFRGATVSAKAVRKAGGRVKVTGKIVRPARVSAAKGCADGSVVVKSGRFKTTVELGANCRFSATLRRGGGTPTARFAGNKVLLPAKAAKAPLG